MDKYKFRFAVSQFLFEYRQRGFAYGGYLEQSDIADALGVRQATVSSWCHADSCISAFMFFRLLQVFADFRKLHVRQVFSDFLKILERQTSANA